MTGRAICRAGPFMRFLVNNLLPLPPLFSELRILNNLCIRTRGSAHSKGVAWARIRLKHGKTRCLSRTAHSKGFSDDLTRSGRERKGFAEKSGRGSEATNTGENSIP